MLLLELPNQIKIFDFFSPLVRALEETITDSNQIISLFMMVVFFQAIQIWTLDNTENFYLAGLPGIGSAINYSYFMSLGDFAVAEFFFAEEANAELQWLFWVVFYISTYITLLIVLNMVIAIMSASFERVQEENEANIMRSRVEVILNIWFRMPNRYKSKFLNSKYLVSM